LAPPPNGTLENGDEGKRKEQNGGREGQQDSGSIGCNAHYRVTCILSVTEFTSWLWQSFQFTIRFC